MNELALAADRKPGRERRSIDFRRECPLEFKNRQRRQVF